jgi:hypothetical protein
MHAALRLLDLELDNFDDLAPRAEHIDGSPTSGEFI